MMLRQAWPAIDAGDFEIDGNGRGEEGVWVAVICVPVYYSAAQGVCF